MAAILRDSVVVVVAVVAVVVVRRHPRAILLATITMRKSIDGLPFLSIMSMGLRLAALHGPPELRYKIKQKITPDRSTEFCGNALNLILSE